MSRKKVPTKCVRMSLLVPIRVATKIFSLLDWECREDEQLMQYVVDAYVCEKEIVDYDENEESIQPEELN